MKTTTRLLLLMFVLFALCPTAEARKKKTSKAKAVLTTVAKDSVNADYAKVTKGAVVKHGLFTTIHNAKEGKLYFEIPDSAFSRLYLLANRVAATSNTRDMVAGQMATTPIAFRFSKDARMVYMHQLQTSDLLVDDDPIFPAFEKNFTDPVLRGFKIVAENKGNVVIEVTSFFGLNEKCISPIKPDNPLGKLLGGGTSLKGTFVADASGIMEAKTFPENIEIKSRLSFTLTGLVAQPYSVVMHRSIFALPEDPMPMRVQDNRVGFFYSDKSIYSSDEDRLKVRTFIHRWRLEPKEEDKERYFNGELVEPEKPIVFYVDSAFPAKWRSAIHQGIRDWNIAFETAGFKNAISSKDYPENDPNFDPDDMRYSCFKYAATSTANAMGPSHIDPRTGEILTGDVIWYHNILSLLHDWRFIQTGAVDPRVRKQVFDDDVMRESIRYAAAHEIGHTLGLMHNMGASYSFPIDSLRSPSFTEKYGTTPSIMDYARNNYVAQPGDVERGVKLVPPVLGVYDIYAINWGYRLIKDAKTPADEKPMLEKWIAEKANDPMYEFGAQQMLGTVDPTDQTEDLGNDHIKAGNYGIDNLKILLDNLEEWNAAPSERYDGMENMYLEIVKQYNRYLRHVMPYIGGIRFEEIRQGDGKETAKHYIDRETQRAAMQWLLEQARTYPEWLNREELIGKFEIHLNANDKLRTSIISSLMNAAALYRIQEGGRMDAANNFTLSEYMDELVAAIFRSPLGGKLSENEQALQGAAIAMMINNSGLVAKASASGKSFTDESKLAFDDTPAFPCSCGINHAHSFARLNFGLPTLSKEELGVLMTARLKKVLNLYKTNRAKSIGITRDFYDYQIMLLERTFTNN